VGVIAFIFWTRKIGVGKAAYYATMALSPLKPLITELKQAPAATPV